MAQDYWHGGWANGGMLPGTRAAMTAKSAGGSYGPLNALADILGAYWQKKDRDDANKAIEDYENNFDSLVSPGEAPQVSAPGRDLRSRYGAQWRQRRGGPADDFEQGGKGRRFAKRNRQNDEEPAGKRKNRSDSTSGRFWWK